VTGAREVRVTRAEAVPPGRPVLVEVEGLRIVLARVGETIHACADSCAHSGGSLSEGRLSGVRLACPLHGWMYDVRTGVCVLPGRGARVPTYPVRVEAGEVWLTLGAGEPAGAAG
jgi:3-phenylpropionate/trans-cinnamate dioxygenase ferredoxin subunit